VPDPVDWDLARRVAVRVSGREPFSRSYHRDSLLGDFDRFTAEAEDRVAEATGLRSLSGSARARVVDRDAWVAANLASFQRMLRPLLDKMGDKLDNSRLAPVTRRASGVELGLLLGWMSGRVLGQYDLLIVEDEAAEEQDLVYYVGPNVLALEKRYAFPPQEFRLWLALHEVTHRAQFTGVPWLRGHFLGLVEQALDAVDPDPQRLMSSLHQALERRRAGEDPLADGGLLGLVANPEQRAVLERIGGMMSLLEGHGDVTMDRASEGRVPGAARFGRVLRERRASARGPQRLMQRFLGIDAKLKQYAQGEAFIGAVEAAGGRALLDRAWEHPDHLPSMAEIRAPAAWIERMQVSAGAGGPDAAR
jgi:coenzyme F420 biosynthesis associated uncharacterized protein